jgi:hypothetical protein
VTQKNSLDPAIGIPVAIRWMFRKQKHAAQLLGREPTPEEIAMHYKGLLRSKTDLRKKSLDIFRETYDQIKK